MVEIKHDAKFIESFGTLIGTLSARIVLGFCYGTGFILAVELWGLQL